MLEWASTDSSQVCSISQMPTVPEWIVSLWVVVWFMVPKKFLFRYQSRPIDQPNVYCARMDCVPLVPEAFLFRYHSRLIDQPNIYCARRECVPLGLWCLKHSSIDSSQGWLISQMSIVPEWNGSPYPKGGCLVLYCCCATQKQCGLHYNSKYIACITRLKCS